MDEPSQLKVKRSAFSVGRSGTEAPATDPANPWIGLESYTEASRQLFFGRDKEAAELVRLIRRQLLTVLFGQSGLGKSSLLQAGAFPRLREADFLPLYLRLNHDAAAAPLVQQVKEALVAAYHEAGADAPVPGNDETLWEYFHRKDTDIWSAKNRLLTPVLAFDQFEEIFTLGRADDARRARGAAFLQELADLVENRPPAALRTRLDAGDLDPTRYNFDKSSCQVVLVLREDFLPDLEGLKGEMRSILTNRMRIRRLNGTQALEIVQKPAPHLLAEGVAERVVEFVAGARGGSADRLAELEVEPALLSVICRELNERRIKLGHDQITTDLVTGNRREILHDFYERSVADLPAAVREFVEDRLLTKSGFRDNFALETALELPGVTRELIDTLVSRRLLRIEEHLGVPRVELAHDVLAEVVRASRDARQQRVALKEARRHTRMLQGLAAGLVVLLAGASWIAWRAVQARKAEAAQASRTDFMVGSKLLEEGKTPEGLAYLVRAGRTDPTNHVVATRLMSELAFRNFALPVGEPMEHAAELGWAGYSKDGRRCLVWAKPKYYLWDLENGKLLRALDPGVEVTSGDWSQDGRLVAVCGADGSAQVWDLETGKRVLDPMQHEQQLRYPKISPDNRWLCTRGSDNIARIWDLTTGEVIGSMQHSSTFNQVAFSPDGRRLLTFSLQGEWRVWSVPDGKPITEMMKSTPVLSYNSSIAFHPGGQLVVIPDSPTSMRFYDATTGAAAGARMEHELRIYWSALSGDGHILATISLDQTARLWEAPSGKPLLGPLEHGEPLRGVLLSRDGRRLATWSQERKARIWDTATGKMVIAPVTLPFWDFRFDGGEFLPRAGNIVQRWETTPSAVTPLYFAPTPGRVYVQRDQIMPTAWAFFRDRLQEIDILTGRPTGAPRLFPHRVTPHLLSPNARYLYLSNNAGEVELWDLRGKDIVRHKLGMLLERGDIVNRDGFFSRDSSRFGLRYKQHFVRVWDTATGSTVGKTLEHKPRINGATFSNDGSMVIVATVGGYSVLWDVKTSQSIGSPLRDPGRQSLTTNQISPDRRFAATGGFSGNVQIWDANTTNPLGSPLQHRNLVNQVLFTRDSRRLMTRTAWQIRMWDVATGAPLTEPMEQPYVTKDPLAGAVFSDDDRLIASWTGQSEVRVWDSVTGLLIAGPIQFQRQTRWLSFYSENKYLAASDSLGGFAVCPLPTCPAGACTPQWLLRLAENLAGGEIDSRAIFRVRPVDRQVFDEIREQLSAAPDDAPFVEWGRWFLADRATRPVGPGMKLTAEEARKLAAPDPLIALTTRENELRQQGKYAEIEPLNRESIGIAKRQYGENSPELDFRQFRLAETLVMIGRFEEAERLARACLVFREKQGDTELQLAWARVTLGSALVGLKRYAEAEPLLAPGCEFIRQKRGNVSPRGSGLMMHVPQLIQLYEATGRPEKAEEWRKYLATL